MTYDGNDTQRAQVQLSMDVKDHPEVARRRAAGEQVWLHGTLTAKVEIPVREDYNMGDELMVTITDPDGKLVGRVIVEVESPTFRPIREKNIGVIGQERVHKTTQSDLLPTEWINGAPAR